MDRMALKRKHHTLNPLYLCEEHSLSDQNIDTIQCKLRKWYQVNARDLPWRSTQFYSQNDIAYRVLVSEIMLQQTQVKTVINYYNRWMERWPTLKTLADVADIQQVLTMWSGLGYYNRAKRLHETAKVINEKYHGIFPSDYETLMENLPGVGCYTAGAICSIAFNQPIPAVDGNVLRIFSRLCGLSISMFKNKECLTRVVVKICKATIDNDQPGHFNQCLMDIGATVCIPKGEPKCAVCPLSDVCRTYNRLGNFVEHKPTLNNGCHVCENATTLKYSFDTFPGSVKSKPSPVSHYVVIALELCDVEDQSFWLLSQRPSTGLLCNLWEFIVVDAIKFDSWENASQVKHFLTQKISELVDYQNFSVDVSFKTTIKHIFSHRVHFYALFHAEINERFIKGDDFVSFLNTHSTLFENDSQGFKLVNTNEMSTIAISTSVKKMLKYLKLN